jgi:xyloglucan-specific exo-beta-1,4-glucanase
MKKYILLLSLVFLLCNCSSSNETNSDDSSNNNTSSNWVEVPFNGDYGVIQSSCTNGQDLFIGTAGQGIYKSVDGGKNWIAINNGLVDREVCKVYYLNNILYATTSVISPGIPAKTRIYKSIDNGSTWISVWNTLYDYSTIKGSYSSPTLISQAIAPMINGSVGTIAIIDSNIFVTIGSYIFKSSNNGIDWKFVKTLDANNQYSGKQFLKVNSSVFLLSSYLGSNVSGQIYKSLDGGNNFSLMNNSFNDERSITSIALSNNIFFIATGSGDTSGNIYHTDENVSTLTLSMKNNLSPLSVICFYSIDNNIFASRNNEVFKSKDNGNNWEQLGEKVDGGTCFNIFKIGNFIYAVTSTKIYKINY